MKYSDGAELKDQDKCLDIIISMQPNSTNFGFANPDLINAS